MENTYKIVWSDEALQNLQKILDYLDEIWTIREVRKFVKQLDNRLQLLEQNPFSFPVFIQSTKLRKSVLTKHISIYYQIVDQNIRLISIFDNRQNPKRIDHL